MHWISLLFGYYSIGAVLGLFHEEGNYRRSTSQRSRALIDYLFSASMSAILWPAGFVLAKEGRE